MSKNTRRELERIRASAREDAIAGLTYGNPYKCVGGYGGGAYWLAYQDGFEEGLRELEGEIVDRPPPRYVSCYNPPPGRVIYSNE